MGDSLDLVVPDPIVYPTPTAWLVSQALELLNTEGERAEVAYTHVVQLLRCRDDAVKTLSAVLSSTPTEDIGLRWGALYITGDVGDQSAADLLFRTALQSLPDPCKEEEGCEGPRDVELLIRTMAVEALQRVAERHEEVGERVLALIAERPSQPVLIEAVKAARALKLADKARELLRKEDHWMLEIKIVPADEVMANPERGDDTALGHTPPNMEAAQAAPATCCRSPRKEG